MTSGKSDPELRGRPAVAPVRVVERGHHEFARVCGRPAGTGAREAGSTSCKAGAGQLQAGIEQLHNGNAQLASGISQLANGGGQLTGGLSQLTAGAGALQIGLGQLSTGAGQLATGLAGGVGPAGQLTTGLGHDAGSGDQVARPDPVDRRAQATVRAVAGPIQLGLLRARRGRGRDTRGPQRRDVHDQPATGRHGRPDRGRLEVQLQRLPHRRAWHHARQHGSEVRESQQPPDRGRRPSGQPR